MKKILALDIAQNCGFARNYGGEPRSGSVHFDRQKTETKKKAKEPIGVCFIKFQDWLNAQEGLPDLPDVVVYEIAHFRGRPATESCVGLWAVMALWTAKNKIPIEGVRSQDLKVAFTGFVRSDKKAMVRMARKLGYEIGEKKDGKDMVDDDDQADACLMLEFMKHKYAVTFEN